MLSDYWVLRVLYTFCTKVFHQIWVLWIFSPNLCLAFSFSFLLKKNPVNFGEVQFTYFQISLWIMSLVSYLINLCQTQGHRDFLSFFLFFRNAVLLGFIFKSMIYSELFLYRVQNISKDSFFSILQHNFLKSL